MKSIQRLRLTAWDRGIVLLLILTLVFGGTSSELFLAGDNLNFVISDVSEILLIAFPMALLIIVRDIDLSVASSLTLASAVIGIAYEATLSMPIAVIAGLLTGSLCGLVNGLLVTKLGLSSLAVTIGTLALYRGLCFVLLGDMPISSFPMEWTDLAFYPIGSTFLPWSVVLLAAFGGLFWYLLHGTRFGRWCYAIGQGEEAAAYSGIPVGRVRLILFVLTGFMAGLAGFVYTLRFASASPDGAMGYELIVIAAVLFGGVAIAGGIGTMWGVIAAVLVWGASRSLLQLAGFDANALVIVSGLLLLVSVAIPRLISRVRDQLAHRSPRSGAATRGEALPPSGSEVVHSSPAGAGHDQGSN